MKRFQCSYVAKDRPETMEIWAQDAQEAVCAALEQLGESEYRRMEVSDEHGLIYFRQGPSRRVPAFRKFVRTVPAYVASSSIDIRPNVPENSNQDIHRLAS